jgi:hypothetical protein
VSSSSGSRILLLGPKLGGNTLIQNAGKYLPVGTAQPRRKLKSSYESNLKLLFPLNSWQKDPILRKKNRRSCYEKEKHF